MCVFKLDNMTNKGSHSGLYWVWDWSPSCFEARTSNLKSRLFSAMRKIDKLSNNAWHFHRKLLNPNDFPSRQFAVNRAFYKLWEIMGEFPNLLDGKEPTVLHLAEAPGSFVQVIKSKFPDARCIAVSKPPSSYAEVVKSSRCTPVFNEQILKLPKVEFMYEDLLNVRQLESFLLQLTRGDSDGYHLITADGGFDEDEQYESKEPLHYRLILAEIICIVSLQRRGGSCVLKVFETFTETTLSLLYLLALHYEKFDVCKPITSRSTNSEKYIICRGFRGHLFETDILLSLLAQITHLLEPTTSPVLNLEIPDTFREGIYDITKSITEKQIYSIDTVCEFANRHTGREFIDKKKFEEEKKICFKKWCEKYSFN